MNILTPLLPLIAARTDAPKSAPQITRNDAAHKAAAEAKRQRRRARNLAIARARKGVSP